MPSNLPGAFEFLAQQAGGWRERQARAREMAMRLAQEQAELEERRRAAIEGERLRVEEFGERKRITGVGERAAGLEFLRKAYEAGGPEALGPARRVSPYPSPPIGQVQIPMERLPGGQVRGEGEPLGATRPPRPTFGPATDDPFGEFMGAEEEVRLAAERAAHAAAERKREQEIAKTIGGAAMPYAPISVAKGFGEWGRSPGFLKRRLTPEELAEEEARVRPPMPTVDPEEVARRLAATRRAQTPEDAARKEYARMLRQIVVAGVQAGHTLQRVLATARASGVDLRYGNQEYLTEMYDALRGMPVGGPEPGAAEEELRRRAGAGPSPRAISPAGEIPGFTPIPVPGRQTPPIPGAEAKPVDLDALEAALTAMGLPPDRIKVMLLEAARR